MDNLQLDDTPKCFQPENCMPWKSACCKSCNTFTYYTYKTTCEHQLCESCYENAVHCPVKNCTNENIEEVKPLTLKEIKRIIPHVFLLLNLPNKLDLDEVVLEETLLLNTFCSFLSAQRYDERHFPNTVQAFNLWRQVQDSYEDEILSESITALKAGQSLPVYVRAQNAGLLFTCSDTCCDGHPSESTIMSTFASSQKAVDVSSAEGDLSARCPMVSVHLPNTQLLTSELLAKQINSLNQQSIPMAMTKVKKSNSYYTDERDVADPIFVSKWMCGLLCDTKSCLCTKIPRIIKKVRDEVVFGNSSSFIPSRRSGIWMSMKVVLQILLIKELGPTVGQQLYKMILLKFMCTLSSLESITADTGIQVMAKVARRLYKLDSLRNDMDITNSKILDKLHKAVEITIGSLRERLDSEWKVKVDKDAKRSRLFLSGNFDFHNDSKHSLVPLLNYIKSRAESKESNHQGIAGHPGKVPIPVRDSNLSILQEMTFAKLITFSSQSERDLKHLFCFEYSVLQNLCNSQAVNYAVVGETFISYLKAAENLYKDDQVGISRAILVCLKIFWWVDQEICKLYTLIQDHETGIPINIIEHLMLLFKSDLKLAHDLETYFNKRNDKKCYPSLLAPYSRHSLDSQYSVRHAKGDEVMQKKLQEILAEGERKADDKMNEVRRSKINWEKLKSEFRSMSCKCIYSYSRKLLCTRCHLERQASDMRVNLFEKPLPLKTEIQNAIVFELLIPEPIFYFREMLFALLEHLKVLTVGQQCMAMWPKELSCYAFPHSGNLSVSLGSKRAPQDRYYPRELHPSEDEKLFVVENTGDVQLCIDGKPIESHQKIPLEVIKRFTFQVELGSPYSSLQWVLDNHDYKFSDNEILAKQNECPTNLSLVEFKEFGTVRAGHRIQLRNLYRVLKHRTLSLNTESVLSLVYEVLWRAGPPSDDPSFPSYIRESHIDLLCPEFLTELLLTLETLISSFSKNWNDHHSCAAVIAILLRIIQISEDDSILEKCFPLLQDCREMLRSWCTSIEQILDTMENEQVAEQNKIRKKLVAVATLCCCTYWSAINEDLSGNLLPWLLSVKTIQEYLGGQEFLLSSSKTFRNQVRRFLECGYANLKRFHEWIVADTEILQAFTKHTWSGLSLHKTPLNWTSSVDEMRWFTTEVPINGCITFLQLNILEGHFLVNGKPQDYLPSELKSHVDYTRIFDDFIIKVQPLTESPWSAMSKHPFRGEKMKFVENQNSQLSNEPNPFIISALDVDELEYVPENAFQNMATTSKKTALCLQTFLIRDYTHWWNEMKRCIDFRRKKCHTIKFCLDLDSRLIMETVSGRLAIGNTSSTYKRIMHILTRFEKEEFIEIFLQAPESSDNPEKLAVQLPRMRLHFEVVKDGSKLCVSLLEYPGMKVAEDQNCGTLVGLKSYILLEPIEERFSNKLIVIPHGKVNFRGESGTVEIDTNTLQSPPYFTYEVDQTLRQLKCGQTKSGSAYLAYLHALTSYPLPDPLTLHTGTERALQLLQSGHCWSCEPYDEETTQILLLIAKLSPMRKYNSKYKAMTSSSYQLSSTIACSDAYEIIVDKLISDSQRLLVLFESKQNVELDSKNERILCQKSYWRYFKCTTAQGHISSQFLAMQPAPIVNCETFDCNFATENMKAVFELGFLVDGWSSGSYSNSNLYLSIIKDKKLLCGHLKPFPVNVTVAEWQSSELEFWNSWLRLYVLAKEVKDKNLKHEWKMILTTYAFIGIPKEHLILLHTIAIFPERFANIDPPNCETYVPPEQTTFDTVKIKSVIESNVKVSYLSFLEQQNYIGDDDDNKMTNLYEDRRNSQILGLTQVLRSPLWPFRSCCSTVNSYHQSTYSFLNLENIKVSVNILLNKWVDNYELKQFLDKVERIVLELSTSSMAFEDNATEICQKLSLETTLNDSNDYKNPVEFSIYGVKAEVNEIDAYEEAKVTFQQGTIVNSCALSSLFTCIPLKSAGASYQEKNTHENTNYDSILSDPTVSDSNCGIWTNLVDCLRIDSNNSALLENCKFEYIKDDVLSTKLQCYFEFCAEEQRKYWSLAQSMITSDPLVNILVNAGIYQRITPLTTLPMICHKESTTSNFHNCLRNVLGAFGVAETCKKHALRCLKYLNCSSQFELHRELINAPHLNWSPTEKPEWLLLEIEMDLLVRPIQKQIAEKMENPVNQQNTVTQLNMGEGKTAVITPLLILSLANKKQLCRVTVLRSLFNTNKQALELNLGGLLLNRRVYSLPCRRDFPMDAGLAKALFDVYMECMEKGGINLTTPEYRLSFQLKTYEQCKVDQHPVAILLLQLQEWLKNNARDIVDESDEILHVKYQLVYALGVQMPPVGGSQRWTLLQRLLEEIPEIVRELAKSSNVDSVEIFEDVSEKAHFPHCRLLKIDIYNTFCEMLADRVLSGTEFPNLQTEDKKLLRAFLTNEKIDDSVIQNIFTFLPSESASLFQEKALILRGLMACGVLYATLNKRWRVNYGVSPSGRTPLAVPFRAKDVASERTEFGHPDVALVLTHLSYYYSGLSESQVSECLFHVMQGPNPEMEYDSWLSAAKNEDPSIKSLRSINLDDPFQRNEKLYPALKKNKAVIDFWLGNIVLKVALKQFPSKTIGTAWDLASHLAQKTTNGFSGTNDTQLLLPLTIVQKDLPELQLTNCKVFRTLLLAENNNYESLPCRVSSEYILKKLVRANIPLLLDVGALMLDLDNEAVAKTWLALENKTVKKAAIYFSAGDRLMVLDRSSLDPVLFEISPFRSMLDQCVIYLDDVHTRGTDLKFPAGIKGCVTLGKGVTKDKLVQGCMRLRRLGNGHTVCFWASDEVNNEITAITSHDRKLHGSADVLRWALNNSRNTMREGFPHWIAAACTYLSKTAAQRKYNESGKMDHDRIILASQVSIREVTELKEMYGNSCTVSSFPAFAAKQLEKHCPHGDYIDHEQESYKIDVIERCKTYVPDLKKNVYLLDEEQERELEKEQQEEREVERPGMAKPSTPKLDMDMIKFLQKEHKLLDYADLPSWALRLPEGLKLTSLNQHNETTAWGNGVFITTDFFNTIETEVLRDFYLRTVNWMASFKMGDSHCLLLLSPFEVNMLIPMFRSTQLNASLHMYAARISLKQSTLLELNDLVLPIQEASPLTCTPDFHALNASLSIFSGTMFFHDSIEFESYCGLTGYVPHPRSDEEEQVLSRPVVDNVGFMLPSPRQQLRPNCRFQINPEQLIVGVIFCRYNHFSRLCHVARLVHECSKPKFEKKDNF